MDIIFSTTINRHLRKIQHECEQLLEKGVFQDEIDSHPINVPTFGRGELISDSEIENIERLYNYLSDKKIAVRNLPANPSIKEGTLDYAGNIDDGIEYITTQYVTVFDYDALDNFVNKKVFNVSPVNSTSLDHLIGRALTFDGKIFEYHDNKLKLDLNSNAFNYLRAILTLAKKEEMKINCTDIAEMCGEPVEGFTKTLKNSLKQTILPKFRRFHEKSDEYNFSIDSKQPDVIVVKNPRWYRAS